MSPWTLNGHLAHTSALLTSSTIRICGGCCLSTCGSRGPSNTATTHAKCSYWLLMELQMSRLRLRDCALQLRIGLSWLTDLLYRLYLVSVSAFALGLRTQRSPLPFTLLHRPRCVAIVNISRRSSRVLCLRAPNNAVCHLIHSLQLILILPSPSSPRP